MENNKKFQWTVMFNSERGSENITIRTDDKAEFDLLMAEYGEIAKTIITPPMTTREQKIHNFTKEYEANEKKCPKCGNQLKESWSKDKTKHFMKCSTAGWDRVNMRSTGCDYIEWLK